MKRALLVAALLLPFPSLAQTVGSDGSLAYGYAFQLPPAVGRHQPSLSLAYSSLRGASEYGVGWSLSVRYVEQDQRATLNTDGSVRSRFFLAAGGSRQLLARASDGTYRPDVASGYLSLSQSGTSSTSSGSWTAIDGAGTHYYYSCLGASICSRWYLTSVTDADGHTTSYGYDTNLASQSCIASVGAVNALLTDISYDMVGSTPTHEVKLTYAPSTGSTSAAAGGCLVSHARELVSVTASRLGTSTTLGSWTLAYTQSVDTSRDLLTSIQANDRGGSPFGIATSFAYEGNNLTSNSTGTTSFGAASGFTKFQTAQPLTRAQQSEWGLSVTDARYAAAWVDLDGDGLPDLVWGGFDTGACPSCTTPPSPAPTPGLRWAHNRGGLSFDPPALVPGSQNWQGVVTSAYYVDKSLLVAPPPPGPGGVGSSSGLGGPTGLTTTAGKNLFSTFVNTLLIDFNGDGYPDLVTGGAALPYDSSSCPASSITVRFSQYDSTAPGLRSFGPPVCVDASGPLGQFSQLYEASSYMPLQYSQTAYPKDYTFPGTVESFSQPPVQYTWVKLADMNGDGILDYVVADCGVTRPQCAKSSSPPPAGPAASAGWWVYPGYRDQSGNWRFRSTPYQMHPTGTLDVAAAVDGASPVPVLYPIEQAAGTTPKMLLTDINGDGFPDHVFNQPSEYNLATTGDPITSAGTTLDVDTGVAGGAQDFLPSSFTASTFGNPNAILQDVNGDGRPDLISAAPQFWINTGSALVAGATLTAPSGVAFYPYGNPNDPTVPQQLVDADGDGVLDYVYESTFYKGRYVTHKSDLMIGVTTASGAHFAVGWGASSDYGVFSPSGGPSYYAVSPGVETPKTLVEAITTSGPAMDPLTVSYTYATPMFIQPWDDPTGDQREMVGYFERFDISSVGQGLQHTQFGNTSSVAGILVATYPTGGTPVLSETGTRTSAFVAGQVPSFSSVSTTLTSWATQFAGCSTACPTFPVYLYASEQDQYRPELSTGPVSTVTNAALDAFGHVTNSTVVSDKLSASSSTVIMTRAYATGSGSQCVDCLLEEKVTDSSGATELAHRYLHYDWDTSPATASATRGQIGPGHLSYVEYSVSAGVYDVPSVTFYDTSGGVTAGLPLKMTRTYAGQQLSTLSQSFVYDSTGTELVQTRVDSDTTASNFVDYVYDAWGAIIEQHGPYLAGAATYPVASKAYDAVGRVVLEAQSSVMSGSVSTPVRAYSYTTPTTAAPGSVATYQFVRGSGETLYYVVGSVPQTDDAALSIRYFDGLGRTIQTRNRLGSGTSGSTGNVLAHLPAQFVVSSNVVLDGLGRTVASFDPYFSGSGLFADPRSSAELQSAAGLHATSFAYDNRSRPVCKLYAPVSNGVYVAAPATAGQCVSNFREDSLYRRASSTSYGVDGSLDGRNYLTVDVIQDWSSPTATPGRTYLDSSGRVRYARTPSGTYEQTMYDLVGRRTGVVRTSGPPGASAASVTTSWTYDNRGRVTSEFADAAGTKYYSYLPTGEVSQVIQNATSIANKNAVWSTFVIGAFGRIVERDDSRWTLQLVDNCQQSAPVTDKTTFQYDNAYLGNTARYGASTAGLLTASFTSASTLAFGFDAHQSPQVRDEWTPDGAQHTVSELLGVDGRLLQRTVTSPSLTSYSPAGTVGYAFGYDSAGRPVQITGPYQTSTFTATLSLYALAPAPANALWAAGSGTDPTTGPYDALGRLANERWDAGAITKSKSFLPGSNLLASDATNGAASNNIYTTQYTAWQAGLVAAYSVSSHQDGGGTSYQASYDSDGHLWSWSAAAAGSVGLATQQFNEGYTFSLENFSQVTSTNNLGFTTTASYQYNDASSKERVTAITIASQPTGDYFAYDRRGRGLITGHMLTAAQNPSQDSYEYDVQARLIAIGSLGTKTEDLTYDAASSLVARTFAAPVPTASGTETARYYLGDDLTIVEGTQSSSAKQIGYVHVRLGSRRIVSVWAKTVGTASTNGLIYYHRDMRGSVVATTTAGGLEANTYRYLPSGALDKVLGSEQDETTSELGYIGGIRLSGGLVHLRARAYSPLARRFIQADTVDFVRYTYGRGDFLNYSDPSGRYRTTEPKASLKLPVASVEGIWGTDVTFDDGSGRGPNGFAQNQAPTMQLQWVTQEAYAANDANPALGRPPALDGADGRVPQERAMPDAPDTCVEPIPYSGPEELVNGKRLDPTIAMFGRVDYTNVTIAVGMLFVGPSLSVLTVGNHHLVTVSLGIGKVLGVVGGSFTAGHVFGWNPQDGAPEMPTFAGLGSDSVTPPSQAWVISNLTGWGVQVSLGGVVGMGGSFPIGQGNWTIETGLMTPQAGVSVGYTLDATKLFHAR